MLSFRNFLHNETAAIGLTSLGLARKIENKTSISPKTKNETASIQLKQNLNTFTSNQTINTINKTVFQDHEKTINSLFNRNSMLNFNNGKLIG